MVFKNMVLSFFLFYSSALLSSTPNQQIKVVKTLAVGHSKSACSFQLSEVGYDANEEPTIATANGKISANLWQAINEEIQKQNPTCLECSHSAHKSCIQKVEEKMNAEDLNVYIFE